MVNYLAHENGAFVVENGAFVTEASYDSGGGGDGGDGGGSGPGGSPQTTPTQPPADRAAQAGLTINTTTTVTSTSQINGDANTLHIIDGNSQDPFTWDGPMDLGSIDDTAICGINGASISLPAGFRDRMITVSGGSGFLWSGVDIDQTASGAWGRFNINTSTNGIIEFVRTIGKGRRANPDPSEEPYGATTGATISIPAGSSSGTNHIRNVEFIHGGVFANQHFGDRPIGIFLAGGHSGTLRIERSVFEEFPNNGLYATNTTGEVIVADTRIWNNGVTNGRIARGEFINCVSGFDYTDTGMMNANNPGHAVRGFSVEDKGKGTDVDITNCTVRLVNVANAGGGIVTDDFGDGAGTFDQVTGTDVHIYNAQDVPDVRIEEGSINAITDCTFEGTADSGVSVQNNGPSVTVSNNSFDYPAGRQRYAGPID
ncbi:hypothetical protein [Halococcus sp. PRR34]|uniref:hypothetical protein n=1 Tax=Halococcus sp. PRR34 TaxID=3020830 RepID=UPI00235E5D5C|nr:hypothetical protein [Halococcus sp. PRR34]